MVRAGSKCQSGIPSQKLKQSSGSVIDTCSPFSQKKNGKQNKLSTNKDFYIKVKKKRKWTKYFTQTRTDVFTRPKHLHKRLKEHKVSGNSHIKDESDPILQFKPPKLEWGVWEWGEASALLGNRSPSVSNFVVTVAVYPLESHSQHHQLLPKCILAQPGIPTHRMYDEVGDGFVPKTSNNGRTQCWEMRTYSVVR